MDKTASVIVTVAAVVAIVAGGIYISKSFRVDCVDFWPFSSARTCAVTAK